MCTSHLEPSYGKQFFEAERQNYSKRVLLPNTHTQSQPSQPICYLVVNGGGEDLLPQSSQLFTSIACFSFSLLPSPCRCLRIQTNYQISERRRPLVSLILPGLWLSFVFLSALCPGVSISLSHRYLGFNTPNSNLKHLLNPLPAPLPWLLPPWIPVVHHLLKWHSQLLVLTRPPLSCSECPSIVPITVSGAVMCRSCLLLSWPPPHIQIPLDVSDCTGSPSFTLHKGGGIF
jgi:hypothetical protein